MKLRGRNISYYHHVECQVLLMYWIGHFLGWMAGRFSTQHGWHWGWAKYHAMLASLVSSSAYNPSHDPGTCLARANSPYSSSYVICGESRKTPARVTARQPPTLLCTTISICRQARRILSDVIQKHSNASPQLQKGYTLPLTHSFSCCPSLSCTTLSKL